MEAIKLFERMTLAAKAIGALKTIATDEEFRFFLNRLGLRQVETPAPADLAAPQPIESPSVQTEKPAAVMSPPAEPASNAAPTLPVLLPARTPEGLPPQPRLVRRPVPPPSGDFAAKIKSAAVKLGLEDPDPLSRLRKAVADTESRGSEYWDHLREATIAAIKEGGLAEADWQALKEKMKINLFLRENRGVFISGCPKEILTGLLLDLDGLSGLVARIGNEVNENKASVHRIAFIIESCIRVGAEAEPLLQESVRVVRRMRQRKFIGPEHWLIKKIERIEGFKNGNNHKPEEETAGESAEEAAPATAPADQPSDEELERAPTEKDFAVA